MTRAQIQAAIDRVCQSKEGYRIRLLSRRKVCWPLSGVGMLVDCPVCGATGRIDKPLDCPLCLGFQQVTKVFAGQAMEALHGLEPHPPRVYCRATDPGVRPKERCGVLGERMSYHPQHRELRIA